MMISNGVIEYWEDEGSVYMGRKIYFMGEE